MTADDPLRDPRERAEGPVTDEAPQLRHVRIVADKPEDDAPAVRLLEHALGLPEVVHLMVLGRDARATQIVGWAQALCERGSGAGRGPERRVLWIRDPDLPEVRMFLAMLLWLPLPRVAVLTARDWVRVRIAEDEPIDEEVLERAFRRG